jgi:hypothetical protein
MNTKKTLALGLSAIIVIIDVGMVLVGQRNAETTINKKSAGQPAATPAKKNSAPTLSTPEPEVSVIETKAPVQTAPVNVSPVPKRQNATARVAPPGGGKEPIQDPDAREALSLVGADPVAEQYWMAAINDPSLPANERKDLIEDLNEDGLSDPKHPGPQDLSLILSRIRLIESLAPLAMDSVNADAFDEAYKDLKNMLAGKPVQ